MSQPGLQFPQSLSDKYQPSCLDEFVGLEKPRKVLSKFAANPYASAWRFLGNSGTGKTSMGRAICKAVDGELHLIASQTCDARTVASIPERCQYFPRSAETGKVQRFHFFLVEEADRMTDGAQIAFLSVLDAIPDNCIIVFTCNSVERLEARFLSRCRPLDFSSYGMAEGISGLLQRVWDRETDNPTDRPNFARIAKDSNNNVRDALMTLEVAIMGT